MRVLNPGEIKRIFLEHFAKQYGEEAAKELLEQLPDCKYAKAIAKAQYDFDMKEFVEWLEEDCPHISQDNPYMGFRCKPNCRECRQSLKQAVEEK